MSVSECQKCGGHIPLGPDASNVCEDCGAGVFDDTTHCTWTEDDDGYWHSACGNMHRFIECGPGENHHRFCPYCGRSLVGVPAR